MEKIVEQGLLYDYYGELLTEHQRNIYEGVVFNDMSLSEIAEETGISRQGVWDIIKRAEETLRKTEEKTGLIRRFREHLEAVAEMEDILTKLTEQTEGEARALTEQLSETLNKLKG